jgi:predicted nucleic acid-binding protein
MNIFIDSNIFLDMLSGEDDGKYKEIFDSKSNRFFTNTLVLNEVRFKLLFIMASQRLKTTKKFAIIKKIKSDKTLRELAYARYIDFFATVSAHCTILPQPEEEVASYTLTKDIGLLPADADIIMSMRQEGITTILTTDDDFKKVPGIKVMEP